MNRLEQDRLLFCQLAAGTCESVARLHEVFLFFLTSAEKKNTLQQIKTQIVGQVRYAVLLVPQNWRTPRFPCWWALALVYCHRARHANLSHFICSGMLPALQPFAPSTVLKKRDRQQKMMYVDLQNFQEKKRGWSWQTIFERFGAWIQQFGS